MNNDIKASLQKNIFDAMMMMQSSSSNIPPLEDTSTISASTMNSAQSNATMESLITIIKNLESKVNSLKSEPNSKQPSNFVPTNEAINPKTGKEWKRYCYSCGCCPRASKNCPVRKQGHQDSAIFQNRMNGSDQKCYPLKK